jgi:L-amino acid N-acyltransferase YncA
MLKTKRPLLCEKQATAIETAQPVETHIRAATPDDFPAMLRIFRRVTESGDTYVHSAQTSVAEAHAYWFDEALATFVAEQDGRIVGMYRIIENQRGRGAHVANASLMVDPSVRGQGQGLALGRHCLAEAKKEGFLAMQFNMVVSTNAPAVALWKKLGFAVVGTLPGAFWHARLGRVNAYVMWRSL